MVSPVQAVCSPLARPLGVDVTCGGRVSDPPLCICRNALDGLIKIARTEGPAQRWRGTDLSLAVCVPAIAVYFPLYEHALQHLQSAGNACCRLSCSLMSPCVMLRNLAVSGIEILSSEILLLLMVHHVHCMCHCAKAANGE